MKRTVSVFGLGYVGSVTAACLAHLGHHVVGVDSNASKTESLESGRSPIIEKGLDDLIATARKESRLRATTDAAASVLGAEISLICVGTPSQPNGKLDLAHIRNVCKEIGQALRQSTKFHWVVLRSTVLPGTTDTVVVTILEEASGKRAGVDFAVCYNPEFIREGTAVADFFEPPFTVLGASDKSHVAPLRDLYEGVNGRVFETSLAGAEMVKGDVVTRDLQGREIGRFEVHAARRTPGSASPN